MIKFTTESGAQYLYDEENLRIKRLEGSPYSPGIHYHDTDDDTWHGVVGISPIVQGKSVHMVLTHNKFRLTTPVVEVENG